MAGLDPGAGVGRVGGERRLPFALAQLVQGGVAGDAEEPTPRRTAAGVESVPPAVRPLEGERGDILGRDAVAQQSGHVAVDVIEVVPVEPFEVRGAAGLLVFRRNGFECHVHMSTTNEQAIRHKLVTNP